MIKHAMTFVFVMFLMFGVPVIVSGLIMRVPLYGLGMAVCLCYVAFVGGCLDYEDPKKESNK